MLNKKFLFRFTFVILFFLAFESINIKPIFNSNSTGALINQNISKIDDSNFCFSLSQIDVNKILRISAHVLVFGLLSLIVFWSLGCYNLKRIHRIILTITICLVFGLIDEVIQLYTPNRQFRYLDILKDGIGAFIFSTFLYNPAKNLIKKFHVTFL